MRPLVRFTLNLLGLTVIVVYNFARFFVVPPFLTINHHRSPELDFSSTASTTWASDHLLQHRCANSINLQHFPTLVIDPTVKPAAPAAKTDVTGAVSLLNRIHFSKAAALAFFRCSPSLKLMLEMRLRLCDTIQIVGHRGSRHRWDEGKHITFSCKKTVVTCSCASHHNRR